MSLFFRIKAFYFLLTVRHLLMYFLILLQRESWQPRFPFAKVFPLERSPVLVEGNGLEESGMKVQVSDLVTFLGGFLYTRLLHCSLDEQGLHIVARCMSLNIFYTYIQRRRRRNGQAYLCCNDKKISLNRVLRKRVQLLHNEGI